MEEKVEDGTSSKTSLWIPNNKHKGCPNDHMSSTRRKTWISQADEEIYQVNPTYIDDHMMTLKGSIGNRIPEIQSNKEEMNREMRLRDEYFEGHANSRKIKNPWDIGRNEPILLRKNSKIIVEHISISTSSSAINSPTTYCHGDPQHRFESMKVPFSIQDSEPDQADILHKYKERDSDDGRFFSSKSHSVPDFLEGESWRRSESIRQLVSDNNVYRSGSTHQIENMHNLDSYRNDSPFPGQLPRVAHFKLKKNVLKSSTPSNAVRTSSVSNKGISDLYNRNTHHHHTICSCPLCYGDEWQGQDLSSSMDSLMSPKVRSIHSLAVEQYNQQVYNPRMAKSTPRELSSDLAPHYTNRFTILNTKKRLCQPINGGAPFTLCIMCFRLLILPHKLNVRQTNNRQIQCGSCSTVMLVNLPNCSVSFVQQKKSDPMDVASGSGEMFKDSRHHCDNSHVISTKLGFYNAVGCLSQSLDHKIDEVPREQSSGLTSTESLQLVSVLSSPSSIQKSISDNVSVADSLPSPNYVEMPTKTNLDYQSCDSPLHSSIHKLEQNERNSTVKDGVVEIDIPLNRSEETIEVATDKEVLVTEVPTSEIAYDSSDIARDENEDANKTDTMIMKQSSLTRTDHGSFGRTEVYVNGQFIPYPFVQSAQEFAGPIQPGEYWYDVKAGFWGVMGHYCLGIIPPSIQEFNFPMPKDCSNGNTTIYVNGRELHQKDLALLIARGLPSMKNKKYIIDINGKVLEEKTKAFINHLGKLAPTVERTRRGFGMRVPKDFNS